VGIPASELERIFERFYRVDKARSRDTGGTGLGLAIVRHVVRNHGGEIEVASREGEGSTFTILLPHAGDQTEAELDSSVAAGEAGESDSTVTR
jgi:two-component system sensor histidine kinase SenX3